jgi:hypothetical protein
MSPIETLHREIHHEQKLEQQLALLASLAFALVAPATASAQQQQQKPNILVIMGDDITAA